MRSESAALTWARFYLELGLHPIPLSPRSKVPPKGFPAKRYQAQAPTPAELEKWFGAGGTNVGVILGRGVIAVDLDGPGAEQLLVDAGVDLPADAPRNVTANGSHILLAVPDQVGNRVELLASTERRPNSKKPLSQVDIRGDGGYIVVPPSVHETGHVYEWERRPAMPLPPAPRRLLKLIAESASKPAAAAQAAHGGADTPNWVSEALRGVRQGLRDITCTKLAGYFLGKKVPKDIVREQLYAWAALCAPPFPRDQVDKCVNSVNNKDVASALQTAGVMPDDAPAEFQILGYNQGSYFYLPHGSQQVVELRAEQHSKLQLLRLAPLNYWELEYAGRQGVQWDMAANALIRKCERAGVYDTERIRGRGAWWDGDQAVLHLGDQLVTAGQAVPIMKAPAGRYIYEAAPPLPIAMDAPLDADDASKVLEIAELFSWERPIASKLLAGWCVVAPICGALDWRPHVWVTGPASAGKSWVTDRFVRRMLGNIGLPVQGETTEAGIRQTLGHDARPIVFDEADADDERGRIRIQNILALARQASSETGAVIIKGSPLGIAKTYRIRSCFIFSSIGVAVQQYADQTRVCVLSIDPRKHSAERFVQLQRMIGTELTDSFIQRFIARSIQLIPVIRANARTFAAAGAAIIGSQRLGDQVGPLLAGAYSLGGEDTISPAAARAWVERQDWTEQRQVQDVADEQLCLQRILEHVVRIQTSKGPAERSVAELIKATAFMSSDQVVKKAEAEEILWRMGIRVDREAGDDEYFTVSNTHTAIGDILRGTSWGRGWARVLRRVAGAQVTQDKVRFGAVKSRGVEIPMTEVE